MTDSVHFVATWQTWDAHCPTRSHSQERGRCDASDRFEDVCQLLAEETGTDATRLRIRLATLRRSGLSYEDILSTVSETAEPMSPVIGPTAPLSGD